MYSLCYYILFPKNVFPKNVFPKNTAKVQQIFDMCKFLGGKVRFLQPNEAAGLFIPQPRKRDR